MRVSWSEIEAFMECQTKHRWRYTQGWRPKQLGRGRLLGTLVHEMIDRWWDELPWESHATEFVALNDKQHEIDASVALAPETAEEIADQACYLVERYTQVALRSDAEIVHRPNTFMEVGFYVGLQACVFVFVPDRILRWQGRLYLHEVKTMREWGREELLGRDGQLTAYLWALRASGVDIRDALFDAIKTYQYKGARPAVDSVRRIMTDRSDIELRVFERDLKAVVAQMIAIASHGLVSRNVRQDCRFCDFLGPCQEEQFGGDPQALLHEHYHRKRPRTLVPGPAS